MADLTITTVTLLTPAKTYTLVTLIEDVTAFQPLYYDSGLSKYGLAEASDTAKDKVAGLCYGIGELDGPAILLGSGDRVDLGAILTKGTTYVLSTNNGKIAPQADLVSGDAVVPLFVAETTSIATILLFQPTAEVIL